MNQEGLIHAFIFDGAGGARQIGWNEIRSWSPEEGPIWIHLDFTSDYARKWVQEESSIDEIASEALLSEETRPRTTVIGDFALLSLRGVNLSPGSDPEDMVSIRIWLDQHRIISTRRRTLLSVADMVSSFKAKSGPKTTGEFLVNLTGRLTARMEGVVEGLEDRANQMEEDVLISGSHLLRSQLSEIRRETIMLRRYFAPQREAMIRLYTEKIEWLDDDDRMRLREITDQLIRHIEDLDAIRDRAAVTQEELVNKLSEQMNSRMYILSIVAALFLPLGFFTGLLGINVGGIPGAESKLGFSIFILILLVIFVFQTLFFKKKKWM